MTASPTASAAMPSEGEIHAAFVEAQRQYRAERDANLAKQGYWPDRSPAPLDFLAKVAHALFAPILAEKELHHVTGERITRKDLNNAYREGSEKGRLAAHLIDGVNSPLNACCYRDGCRALGARALAAEAALEKAEGFDFGNGITVESRGDGRWAVNNCGCVLNSDGDWEHEPRPSSRDDDFISRTRFDRDEAFRRAAAIRAQGPGNG